MKVTSGPKIFWEGVENISLMKGIKKSDTLEIIVTYIFLGGFHPLMFSICSRMNLIT